MIGHDDLSVRDYIKSIRDGVKPSLRPAIPMEWDNIVTSIERTYDRSKGNKSTIEKVIQLASKQEPAFARLLNDEPLQGLTKPAFEFQELSAAVRPDDVLAAEASPVLDAMIDYFAHWATRSYEGYYEAVALWVLSTIAARRVVLKWRNGIWPTLYIMLVSKSGRVAKTEAASYGARIIRECGLSYLLAPDEVTPQRMLSKMAGNTVPRNYSVLDEEKKEQTRLRTAFSAQKGWLYDEFGDFLQEIINGKGQNTLFYRLIKQLYDNKKEFTYETMTRGDEVLELPSLNIIGTTAPNSLIPVSNKSTFWTDGASARIVFVTPPADYIRLDSAPAGEATVPGYIKHKLIAWHERLGIPHCEIIDVEERESLLAQAHGEDKKKRDRDQAPFIIERGELPQHEIIWNQAIHDAHQAYYAELVYMVANGAVDPRLESNYIRLPDMALKIAMLLASLENKGVMLACHWHRALQITERWRRDLHNLIPQLDNGSGEPSYGAIEEAVIEVIAKKMKRDDRATARQISSWGNTSLRKAGVPYVRQILENLAQEQCIARSGAGKTATYGPL